MPLSNEAADNPTVIPDPLHVVGGDLINCFQASGFDITEYEIEKDKKYLIPADLMVKDELKPLTYTNLGRLLDYNRASQVGVASPLGKQPPPPIPAATGANL